MEQHSNPLEMSAEELRAATFGDAPPVMTAAVPRDYGWHWQTTPDIQRIVSLLHKRGKRFDIWYTPQAKAVENLLGVEQLPFPSTFEPVLHDLFFRIAAMHVHCIGQPFVGDVSSFLAHCKKAEVRLRAVWEDLQAAPNEVRSMVPFWEETQGDLLKTLHDFEQLVVFFEGVLDLQNRVKTRLTGQLHDKHEGRPSSWVAELVAMYASDTYTTFVGHAPERGVGPSFRTFFEDFRRGIGDAERADSRRMARMIWSGAYKPTPLGTAGYLGG